MPDSVMYMQEWQRGFAAIVLDNGEDSGTGHSYPLLFSGRSSPERWSELSLVVVMMDLCMAIGTILVGARAKLHMQFQEIAPGGS